MPVRGHHYGCYADDEILWNVRVKEVTHGIYENHAWPRPREGLYQFIWYKAQIEAPLIRVPLYSSEALSECLGITVLAPWTDLRASADGIPCRIGPFNRCVGRHVSPGLDDSTCCTFAFQSPSARPRDCYAKFLVFCQMVKYVKEAGAERWSSTSLSASQFFRG